MTFYSILALSCFILSLIGTRLTMLALRKRVQAPTLANMRPTHKPPAPRGGGIAVLFALIICLLEADIHYVMVLALLLLAAVSLLDDLIKIPGPIKLLVQIIATATGLISFHHPIFGDFFPLWMDKFVAGTLWVGATQLFNRLDDLDGGSASEMICVGIGLCLAAVINGVFPSPLSTYGLITGAAGCGFLWWSWYPAKIRLGEVGTVPIGFLLGYLLLLAISSGYSYAAIILPAYYISEGGVTFIRRCWQRFKNRPLSTYYYRLAIKNGRSHDGVARYVFGINILLIFLATRSVTDPEIAIFNISLAYMAVFMLLGFLSHPDQHHRGHKS